MFQVLILTNQNAGPILEESDISTVIIYNNR